MVSLQDNRAVDESLTVAEASQGDDDVVLSVRGVSKKFCRDLKRSLLYGVQDIAAEMTGLRGSRDELRKKEFWALNDVSFELRRGEALGLIGKNGSGKSTLLRVIAGLIKPDAGEVEIRGRVAPLIALGAGFNPVLTGRENIYANMSILGLSKEEIDEQFDEVVAFAEVGEAIDAPVRSYSSGMAARLGFSCAIHTKPDILLIDEVLAVGDIRFRQKCSRRLSDLNSQGTGFILVSHFPQSLLSVCEKGLYLRSGKPIAFGSSYSAMQSYEKDLFGLSHKCLPNKATDLKNKQKDSSEVVITSLFFRNTAGKELALLDSGSTLEFCIEYVSKENKIDVGVFIAVNDSSGGGVQVLALDSFIDGNSFDLRKGRGEIRIRLSSLGLKPGNYTMRIVLSQKSTYTLDFVESFEFSISSDEFIGNCTYYQRRSWNIIHL